jgi:ADP-ribose pyrophosphatase
MNIPVIPRAIDGAIEDRLADVAVGPAQPLADAFRPYERFEVREGSAHFTRDILRVGEVVAVLALDPVRERFVLIRQFRLAAHLATGKGDIVELVAGRVDEGESTEAAARRECREEIGVAPRALLRVFSYMPTPGVTDEQCTLFLALVDSAEVPARAGLADETEATHPFTIPVTEALAAVEAGTAGNLFLISALQWYALNPDRIAALIEGRT